MLRLRPDQAAALRGWFVPDRPGPLIGLHVIQTGNGACFADRWPDPRAVLADSAGNYSLAGDPDRLEPADLAQTISGFVEAPERFVPLLTAAFGELKVWERVMFELDTGAPSSGAQNQAVRKLEPADTRHIWGLSPKGAWIADTWGGPAGLVASGYSWGAFVEGRLVAVACSFFVGERYEDIGVVTEPDFRGMGLSAACARPLCDEILARGRTPSWTTSPNNTPSLRVAEKLGFSIRRRDRLYVIGRPVPQPARRS